MANATTKYLRLRFANTDDNWRVQTLIFFVLTLLTRLPFTSRFLFDHDSVQFALALRKFDVYLHQPHPPGYFLYVLTGRVIDVVLQDANASLVWISIVASALAVAVIFNLGSALFGRRAGWWAALLALTSPMLWFYGEVALTYVVGACFAGLTALLCWKLFQDDRRRLYLSPIVLGIGAGFRPDLLLFLFPLWICAVARLGWRQVAKLLLLLAATVALWFIPMLLATGGLTRYFLALWELWQYNNDRYSIWHAGLASRTDTIITLVGVMSYGVGIGGVFILLSIYGLIRSGEWRTIAKSKALFLSLWIAPPLLFFVVVLIPPYKYAYGLIYLPALLLVVPSAVEHTLNRAGKIIRAADRIPRRSGSFILASLVIINMIVFGLTESGYSVAALRTHERILSTIFSGIERNFPSASTIILGRQRSTFSGYRHVQYYLPDYKVYLADQQTNIRGEKWHAFGARYGKTILSKEVEIPPGTRKIIFLVDPYFPEADTDLTKMNLRQIPLDNKYTLYYKDIPESASAKHRVDRK